MITIYYGQNPIHLVQKDEKIDVSLPTNTFFLDQYHSNDRSSVLEKSLQNPVVIISEDLMTLKNDFFNSFQVLEAAGGIVRNERNEILFIYRRDKWDLPKGKMEKNETEEESATREIEEETGIRALTLQNKITATYHVYQFQQEWILKVSHWFLFTTLANQTLIPQTEEDITSIQWFDANQLEIPMSNTYENIREVLKAFGGLEAGGL